MDKTLNNYLKSHKGIASRLQTIFNYHYDQIFREIKQEIPAEAQIRSNVSFRGPNAWILAFSVVIASVGLNVNSIPVIIGAMLVSPLMGPIFGIGFSLGTNDMKFMVTSLKNLAVMMGIALLAATLYFLITPLNLSNPTELLARTNPTIYDVLIALFGGAAGMFEQCRKEAVLFRRQDFSQERFAGRPAHPYGGCER